MRPAAFVLPVSVLLLATAGMAEDQAGRLLTRSREAMTRLSSLQADIELTQSTGASTGKLLLKRPQSGRLELTGAVAQTVVTDGQELIRYYPKTNQYLKSRITAEPALLPGVGDFGFFRAIGTTRLKDAQPVITYAGQQKLGNQDVEVLEQVAKTASTTEKIRYFISPADFLVRRVEQTTETARGATTYALTLKSLRPDVDVAENAFAWAPPEGAKLFDIRAALLQRAGGAAGAPAAPRDYTANLPKVGATVPDFDLPRPGGERLSLFRAAKERKVTLINFWFVGCPPCRAEFPHFQKLNEELKDKGFQLIAVNRGDTEERIREFIATNKYTFDVVMGGVGEQYTVGKAYGVQAYPTNILIDAQGKVLWRGVGFRDPELKELREAIRTAGVGA